MENLLKKVEELLKNMNDFQKKLSYIDSVRDDADKIHKMQEAIDKSDNFWKVFNEFNENFNNYKDKVDGGKLSSAFFIGIFLKWGMLWEKHTYIKRQLNVRHVQCWRRAWYLRDVRRSF